MEGSKNKLIWVFPLKVSIFLFLLWLTFINLCASSRIKFTSLIDRSWIPSKCFWEILIAIKISQKHLLGIQDLSINDVNLILDEAHKFIKVNQSKNKKIDTLRGKTQINLFFEPSTRTQSSFELAGKRLGLVFYQPIQMNFEFLWRVQRIS